jgi:hypothetical protein
MCAHPMLLLSFQATQAMTATTVTTIITAANSVFLVAVCALVSKGPAVNVVLFYMLMLCWVLD